MEFIVHSSGSKGNLYELEDGQSRILLECGLAPSRVTKALVATPGEYAGLLVTHEHMDHARSAEYFVSIGMPVYMTQGTIDALELPLMPNLHAIEAGELFRVGSFQVLPLPAFHDAQEPVCYVIHSDADGETMLFATDTGYMRNTVGQMDVMAMECNYSEVLLNQSTLPDVVVARVRRSHFSLERLLTFLEACDLSKTRDLILLHLSDHHSNAETFRALVQERTGIPTRLK